ncbi:MAG TPA: hypothetical protein VFZ32_09860 [Micromonosporaceae bacterium]
MSDVAPTVSAARIGTDGGAISLPPDGWRPARKFPESYPGECPPGHYLLHDGAVAQLVETGDADRYAVVTAAGRESIDSYLARIGAPPLAQRYPVLAYGANRNPATLDIKLLNYRYAAPPGGRCIPVLAGTLADADVAACGIHGQGYYYGELLWHSEFSRGVALDVRICLLDRDQLRVLNDSEGLPEGLYSAARIPGVRIAGLPGSLAPLGYVADAYVWASPLFRMPLGFAALQAAGRRIPALTTGEIMRHVLDTLDLRGAITTATGLADDETLPADLTKYLNGQWWYQFNTGDTPIPGYTKVLELVNAAMAGGVLAARTRDHLAEAGLLVPVDLAYEPDASLALAGTSDG